MKVTGIAAIGKNRQLGLNGKLPWKNDSELAHFKSTTKNGILIMGRKTFDSIKNPLYGRKSIVISKNLSGGDKNHFYVNSLENALVLARFIKNVDQNVFVIGGSNVFKQALPHISELIISEVEYDGDADTLFPSFEKEYECVEMKVCNRPSKEDRFTVRKYCKKM